LDSHAQLRDGKHLDVIMLDAMTGWKLS
jgi:hypothetical protein